MVPSPNTPRRRVRGPGRPRARDSEEPATAPPAKKLKYVPGGPGGGGRYVDPDTGVETPVGGTGPGGYNYTGPRGRVGRMNAEKIGIVHPASSPSAYTRPRRERGEREERRRERRNRPSVGPRSSSATAAAAAVAQSDGYKPREERGWEEFHPDLDLDADFLVFSADEVDGVATPVMKSGMPNNAHDHAHHTMSEDGANGVVDVALLGLQESPSLQHETSSNFDTDAPHLVGLNGIHASPSRKRPGRPPRRGDSMLTGLGSPPAPRIAPIPAQNPKERLNLPKPVYRQIDTFAAYEHDHSVAVNYVDRTMANVGYQESDIFDRPERTLIRMSEGSIEEDLDLVLAMKAESDNLGAQAGRVEYDMDEQDDRWLDAHNLIRKEEGVDAIKPAIFEITMTQIEKEWHSLEKRIPKPNPKPPQTHRPRSSSAAAVNGEIAGQGEEQDSKCAICDDGDCENTNAIVFCDGCDLAVHQECYGVPFIPEGQWLCRKCQLIGRGNPSCIFCPNVDGAFKQTNNTRWSHLLCAIWIPEVSLGNTTFMEPVMDVEKVQKQRWKLTCYICQQKMGACIQCGNKNCYQAFHVTCARRARLFLKMKSAHSSGIQDASVLKAFCHKHVPSDWRRENDVEWAFREAQTFYRREMRGRHWADSQQAALAQGPTQPQGGDDALDESGPGNKRKRGQAQKQIWRLPSGAPIVPQIVYHNAENALVRFAIRKRKEFVAEACKYWTLKREARRGAALLKRLQLQMESFSSMEITRRNFAGMGAAGGPRLQRRIEFAEQLEHDMTHIRSLTEQIKEREVQKLEDSKILTGLIESLYFPIPVLLWPILKKAQALDPKGVFAHGFKEIQTTLEERNYTSVTEFSKGIAAVISSATGITVTDARIAEQELVESSVAHSSLTPEQKEKKKLAKRILKAIQGPLDDATRKEAELAQKSSDNDNADNADLDALLDRSIRMRRQSGVLAYSDGVNATESQNASHNHNTDEMEIDENKEEEAHAKVNGFAENNSLNHAINGSASHESAAKPPNGTTASDFHLDETDDDAVIRLQLLPGSDTVPIPPPPSNPLAPEPGLDAIMSGNDPPAPGSAPSLSASGSTHPSDDAKHSGEIDYLAPLSHGGVMWYAEPFDPKGTTLHDERWTGREVLRAMSSDLSELGDEELAGLREEDGEEDDKAGEGDREAEERKKKRKAQERRRKRNRGW